KKAFCDFCASLWLIFLLLEACVNRLYKHIGCPGTAGGAEAIVIIRSEPRSLDLLQSGALFNHVLNAVADNRDHVAIFGHFPFVAQSAVTEYRDMIAIKIGRAHV